MPKSVTLEAVSCDTLGISRLLSVGLCAPCEADRTGVRTSHGAFASCLPTKLGSRRRTPAVFFGGGAWARGRARPLGGVGGGAVTGHRPRVRSTDGACAASVPDRPATRRAAGPGRRGSRSRLLHRAANQRGLPLRRPRAGEVVRRR